MSETERLTHRVEILENAAAKREKRIHELEAEIIRIREALQDICEQTVDLMIINLANEALKTQAGLYVIKNQERVH